MHTGRLQCRWRKQTPQPRFVTGHALPIDPPLTFTGSILIDGIAILVTLFLLWRSQRKKAAVGRRYGTRQWRHGLKLTTLREMQLFLLGYIVISICEIFTIGGFPLDDSVRLVCRHSPTVLKPVSNHDVGLCRHPHRGHHCDFLDTYAQWCRRLPTSR